MGTQTLPNPAKFCSQSKGRGLVFFDDDSPHHQWLVASILFTIHPMFASSSTWPAIVNKVALGINQLMVVITQFRSSSTIWLHYFLYCYIEHTVVYVHNTAYCTNPWNDITKVLRHWFCVKSCYFMHWHWSSSIGNPTFFESFPNQMVWKEIANVLCVQRFIPWRTWTLLGIYSKTENKVLLIKSSISRKVVLSPQLPITSVFERVR